MNELRKRAVLLADKFIKEESDYFLGAVDAEQSNPKTRTLGKTIKENIADGVRMLQSVDRDLVDLYERTLYSKEFDEFCGHLYRVLSEKGRIILSGCGSSGRLCMGVEKAFRRATAKYGLKDYENRIVTIMTGGDYALIRSVENFEDFEVLSQKQVEELKVNSDDLLIGVTATGETTSVVGTAIAASKSGAEVYMVVCSDIQTMLGKIDRVDRLYLRDKVHVLYLQCGALAITGSTRMQSSTIEQAVIMSALESALSKIMGVEFSKENLCTMFEETMDYLSDDSVVEMMADYIAEETETYKQNGYVTYFSEDYVLDILTDTTERGPTFSTPPFRAQHKTDLPLSWAFVKNPALTNEQAWIDCLGREPRCIDWDEDVYTSAGITAKVPDISKERLLEFVIGNEPDPEREKQHGIAVWIDSKMPTEAFERCSLPYEKKKVLVFDFNKHQTMMDIFKHIGMKMAINVISTATMALYGRIDGNYMTYLNISNKKLVDRGARIISELCGVSYEEALTEQYYFSLVYEGASDISATQEAIKNLSAFKRN